MATHFDEPMLRIEHDHTRLDVLVEDLEALARQAVASSDDSLLEDVRSAWRRLESYISRHIVGEEQRIFRVLALVYPDMAGDFEAMKRQHGALIALIAELGRMLEGGHEQVSTRKEGLEQGCRRLNELWRMHSGAEWELLYSAHRRINDAPLPPDPPEER